MSLKKDLLKYTPRKEQTEAINFIEYEWTKNKLNKFFLLNLPTGIGKSYLALMIADFYRKNIDRTARVDIITNSKLLQDQYAETFESINDLKGKENYQCTNYVCSCAQGQEFNRLNKTSCEECPYSYARDNYIKGGISLTNFYLYNLYALHNEKLMESRSARVLIVDECLHPETEITMSDGTKKQIQFVKKGDFVLTVNEETKLIEEKQVIKLHTNINKGVQMYQVIMKSGDVLKITGNHKIKLSSGEWIKTEKLTGNELILTINGMSEIESINKIDYRSDVYNLHIKDNHNYFANNHCVSNCHEFDAVMSDFLSIKITENIIKRFKLPNQNEAIAELKKVKTISTYVDFLQYFNGILLEGVAQMELSSSSEPRSELGTKRSLKVNKVLNSKSKDVKTMEIITDMKQYLTKIELFLKEYKNNSDNWVLEKSYSEKNKSYDYSLEPIWSNEFLDRYVFSRYDMVFLMSGTILNKGLFCELNGLDPDKSVYYSIESPFKVENRMVYYMPVGKMSFAKKEETFKKYVEYIRKILNKYANKKGIIHTNSFELAKWIERDIIDPRLLFHDSSNKDEILKYHFETDKPTVIVSPSMSVGVSFDDDRSRFQIIAKVPYPSLASQKNKFRQSNNPRWYSWSTCASIVQTLGRPVRSDKDYADTIIIDESFGDVMRYSSEFIPNYIQNAIKRINIK